MELTLIAQKQLKRGPNQAKQAQQTTGESKRDLVAHVLLAIAWVGTRADGGVSLS